jgi:hypothetical protein
MDCFAALVMTMMGVANLRPIGTTGKSLRIFRIRVKPRNQKFSAFVLMQISGITPLVSPD